RSWCSINIARISVPRRWRVGVIICDLAAANDYMMRKNPADSFVKSTTDGFVRNFERCERGRASSVHLRDCLLKEIISAGRGIRLEIGASTIALDRVAPFRNAPGKFDLRFRRRFRQTNAHRFVAWRFDVTDINQTGERCRPQACDRAATSV